MGGTPHRDFSFSPPTPFFLFWLIQEASAENQYGVALPEEVRSLARSQAVLPRNGPLRLSVFITRTLQAVLIICVPDTLNSGSLVGLVCHPLPVTSFWSEVLERDEQCHSHLTAVLLEQNAASLP